MPERLFSFTEAAAYLGQSRANLKHHYYNTGYLRGQKKGRTIIFSQAQLDWFGAIIFTPGRGEPALPAALPPRPPDLFTFDEAAARLDLHRRTLEHHYYESGLLRGRKVGHIIVFTRAQIAAFRRRYAAARQPKSGWTPVREQLLDALRRSRGWAAPRLWKGRGLRGDPTWGWWVIGPSGKSEFLGRNLDDALASAREPPAREPPAR